MGNEEEGRWRELRFAYRVPDGMTNEQAMDLESEMLETLPPFLGCDCNDESVQCKAGDWVGSSGPMKDEEENWCWCCGEPGVRQDRNGDWWCVYCHENGVCTDKEGHLEVPESPGSSKG